MPTVEATLQSGEPQQGGTLRVGIEQDVRETDNIYVRGQDRLTIGSTIYDPLFASDEDGELQPALAQSATPSSDLLVWTFTLQQGVQFSNGKAFTAKDVKDNIEAYLDPANASATSAELANISEVDVIDDFTVEFTLNEPEAAFPTTFQEQVYMGDMDARQSMDLDAWNRNPVGTGPYMLLSRVPGDNLTFVRNDTYWRGVPPLDQVIFKPYTDREVAALALQTGEVDVLVTNTVSIEALPSLRAHGELSVYSADSGVVTQALLNFEKARRGGYEDPLAFRQGLAMMSNAREMIPHIIGDFGTYANQLIPPFTTGHDPDLNEIPYDPVQGKALLAQAGYPEGSTIKFLAGIFPYTCEWATAWQSLLVEEGFNVDVQCVASELANELVKSYDDWDAFFVLNQPRSTAGRFFKDRWQKANAAIPDDIWTLRSDPLEDLINQMVATPVDDPEYAALGAQISRFLIQDEVATIPAFWTKTWWAADSKVQGLVVSPLAYYGFLMNAITTVWIEE